MTMLERRCLSRALDIVVAHELNPEVNEAVRYEQMCDTLQKEFKSLPEEFIRRAIAFYDEHKGLIHGIHR